MREQDVVHKPYAPPKGSPLEQKPTIAPRKIIVKKEPPPKVKPLHLMSWDERMQVEYLDFPHLPSGQHSSLLAGWCDVAGVMMKMPCPGT